MSASMSILLEKKRLVRSPARTDNSLALFGCLCAFLNAR